MAEILVLLAEDETLIRMSTQDALESGGYHVITVSNGQDALAVIDDRYSELAGLVTDVRLGDRPDGWEVARHARELNPLIAVVYQREIVRQTGPRTACQKAPFCKSRSRRRNWSRRYPTS